MGMMYHMPMYKHSMMMNGSMMDKKEMPAAIPAKEK